MGKQKHPTTYINLTITKMQSYTRIEVEAQIFPVHWLRHIVRFAIALNKDDAKWKMQQIKP